VVWLVIGLALFRDQPIWYVVQQLQLVFGTTQYCVPSASVQARQRLGLEPLQALFSTLSQAWFQIHSNNIQIFMVFVYVQLMVLSGLCTPQENLNHFGSSKGKNASAPYPQVRDP
jgi:hypothetical protein